jgi:triosephosphate isomerase
MFSEQAAAELTIQYGGSVKPENASSLLCRAGIDGALIGGASLDGDQFMAIVRAGILESEILRKSA